MNNFFFTGNLTKAPEIKFTQKGLAYTRLNVAVTRAYSQNNSAPPVTDYFDAVVWGKQAESCGTYLTKGSRVFVKARVQNNNYTDKNGVKHYSLEIIAESIEFAGGNRNQPRKQNPAPEPKDDYEPPPPDDNDDEVDVPF